MISRCFSQNGAEARHALMTSWSGCINASIAKALGKLRIADGVLSRGGSTSNAEYGHFDECHYLQFDGLRVITVLALVSTTIWAAEVTRSPTGAN